MKKIFFAMLLCILIGVCYLYKDDFVRVYNKYILNNIHEKEVNKDVKLGSKNKYYRDMDFKFVQNTTDMRPDNKQELYNIYYSIINAGKEKFTFYCGDDYKSCVDDVKYLANDQVTLSNINNMVHPFNSFKNIETSYDTEGKIDLKIIRQYSDNDIKAVENKIKTIENELQDNKLSTEDQIKKYHDYIIENSKYDSDRSDRNIINYKSDIAYGPLVEGYALCGGYTDAMAILINNMGIINYKVSSNNHVWNGVNINNKWLNLDLTWDDPVTQNGIDLIQHNFFLINTEKLKQIEQSEHSFDENVYVEMK